jgi:hypothetical protein
MNANAIQRKRRSRARTRGAALVEAAVVLPVMCIFLGLMLYVQQEYKAKQTMMAQSRHDAFSAALHANCGGGGDIGNGFPISIPSVLGFVTPITNALKSAMDFVTSTQTSDHGTSVGGNAHSSGTPLPGRAINAHSYTYCSPKSFSEELNSFVDSALDAAKSLLPF